MTLDEIRDDAANGSAADEHRRRSARPRVDIVATPDAIVVTADVPGLKKSDLTVSVEGDDLVIEGPVAGRSERESSRPWSYHRRFRIRSAINREQISARLQDGILAVTLPRQTPEKPRKVSIE